jgi:hypothetical protein
LWPAEADARRPQQLQEERSINVRMPAPVVPGRGVIMALRAVEYSAAEHLEDLACLAARLKADPQAAALVPGVEAAWVALQAQSEDWDRKRYGLKEAQVGLGNASETLCNVVRNAHAGILNALGYNRRSRIYVTYFPHGLAGFTRAAYLDQLTAVRSLALRCAQDPSAKIQEQAGRLHAAAGQMDAAFARRAEALVAESVSFGLLQVEKLETIGTCRRAGHGLTELYPYDRGRVRSYFRRTYRRRPATGTGAGELAAKTGMAANEATAGRASFAQLGGRERLTPDPVAAIT